MSSDAVAAPLSKTSAPYPDVPVTKRTKRPAQAASSSEERRSWPAHTNTTSIPWWVAVRTAHRTTERLTCEPTSTSRAPAVAARIASVKLVVVRMIDLSATVPPVNSRVSCHRQNSGRRRARRSPQRITRPPGSSATRRSDASGERTATVSTAPRTARLRCW